MSQQINLLLPALRPRFDWLALPVVIGVALVGLVLLGILAALGAMESASSGPTRPKSKVRCWPHSNKFSLLVRRWALAKETRRWIANSRQPGWQLLNARKC